MSRFSKAEAETRGWAFFHNAEETVDNLGDGIFRVKPASVRAERQVARPGHVAYLISEEGETIGKLLERIHFYERHLESLPDFTPEEPAPDPEFPKVTIDPTVRQGENPIVQVANPATEEVVPVETPATPEEVAETTFVTDPTNDVKPESTLEPEALTESPVAPEDVPGVEVESPSADDPDSVDPAPEPAPEESTK